MKTGSSGTWPQTSWREQLLERLSLHFSCGTSDGDPTFWGLQILVSLKEIRGSSDYLCCCCCSEKRGWIGKEENFVLPRWECRKELALNGFPCLRQSSTFPVCSLGKHSEVLYRSLVPFHSQPFKELHNSILSSHVFCSEMYPFNQACACPFSISHLRLLQCRT